MLSTLQVMNFEQSTIVFDVLDELDSHILVLYRLISRYLHDACRPFGSFLDTLNLQIGQTKGRHINFDK